jgi:hypothetical protein
LLELLDWVLAALLEDEDWLVVLLVEQFGPLGFCWMYWAIFWATVPDDFRFSQKITWSRLMTIWSYGA